MLCGYSILGALVAHPRQAVAGQHRLDNRPVCIGNPVQVDFAEPAYVFIRRFGPDLFQNLVARISVRNRVGSHA